MNVEIDPDLEELSRKTGLSISELQKREDFKNRRRRTIGERLRGVFSKETELEKEQKKLAVEREEAFRLQSEHESLVAIHKRILFRLKKVDAFFEIVKENAEKIDLTATFEKGEIWEACRQYGNLAAIERMIQDYPLVRNRIEKQHDASAEAIRDFESKHGVIDSALDHRKP